MMHFHIGADFILHMEASVPCCSMFVTCRMSECLMHVIYADIMMTKIGNRIFYL